MTTETTAAPRANRLGDQCPAWCAQDHSKLVLPELGIYADHHRSKPIHSGPAAYVNANVTQSGKGTGEHVIAAWATGNHVYVPVEEAAEFAGFLEQLAYTTPAQLQALANDVRAAAAVARGEL